MIWRLCIAVFLTAAISLFALNAPAQFNGCPAGFCNPPKAGGGANNTALDGAQNGNISSGATLVLPGLTTTGAGLVYVSGIFNSSCPQVVSAASAHLTFTQRACSSTGSRTTFTYSAPSSGTLTSEVVTITNSNLGAYMEATVFSIKNVNTGSNNGFDSNGSLPNTGLSGVGSITTSNANDFLINLQYVGSGCPFTPSSGWTTVLSGCGFLATQYQKVTATQSATSISDVGSNIGWIADAAISN